MKRLISLLLLAIISFSTVWAQDLAEKCENLPDVDVVTINQSMLKLLKIPNTGSNPVNLSVFYDQLDKIITISSSNANSIKEIQNIVDNYMNSKTKFDRLMKVSEDGDSVCVYSRPLSEKNKNEFLITVSEKNDSGTELSVIDITGNITIEELGQFIKL